MTPIPNPTRTTTTNQIRWATSVPSPLNGSGTRRPWTTSACYLRAIFSEVRSPGPAALGIRTGLSRGSLRLDDPKEGLQWTAGGLTLARILQKTVGRSLSRHERKKLSELVHSPVQDRAALYGPAGGEVLDMLLGKREFAELPGRVPLLVGQRLEIDRGAITARVRRLEDTVVWDEFQAHDAGFAEPFHAFPHGITYTFDLAQHDETVRRALDSL